MQSLQNLIKMEFKSMVSLQVLRDDLFVEGVANCGEGKGWFLRGLCRDHRGRTEGNSPANIVLPHVESLSSCLLPNGNSPSTYGSRQCSPARTLPDRDSDVQRFSILAGPIAPRRHPGDLLPRRHGDVGKDSFDGSGRVLEKFRPS